MAEKIDFEAEGLLDGLTAEERASRLALLERLEGEGMPLEELRAAVQEGRLAVLPVEHALGGEPRYTLAEIAERRVRGELRLRPTVHVVDAVEDGPVLVDRRGA